MSASNADRVFELAVEPRNDQYDPGDDRWRQQIVNLYTELHSGVDIDARGHPVDSAKGTVDELIVAPGSAGPFTAAVECLRAVRTIATAAAGLTGGQSWPAATGPS